MGAEFRTVTKTATVSLHGNANQVDGLLTGRRIELVFDPFDLAVIEVRYGGRSFGQAAPFAIGRHAHPKARPEQPGHDDPPPPGIDYLHLIGTAHDNQFADRINYTALLGGTPQPGTSASAPDGRLPGQMTTGEALAGEEEQ